MGKWYYFDNRGYMVSNGWLHTWLYLVLFKYRMEPCILAWLKSGSETGTIWTHSGAMLTGWGHIDNDWYYFAGNGVMYGAGWHLINNKYYYMNNSGVMAADTWIENYYVDAFRCMDPWQNKIHYWLGSEWLTLVVSSSGRQLYQKWLGIY